MRYAIISDIHANIEALDAVIETIEILNADKILCCGDLVGYFANPNECVARIRAMGITSIAGNHDLAAAGEKRLDSFWDVARHAIIWSRRQLTRKNIFFLRKLSGTTVIDDHILLFHGALHPATEPEDLHLENEADIRLSFKAFKKHHVSIKLAFFAHIHKPCINKLTNNKIEVLKSNQLQLDSGSYYIINPGSVGLSRDNDPRPSFLIYDSITATIEFQRVEHSNETAYRKAKKAGLVRPNPMLAFVRKVIRKLCKVVHCADVDY